MASPYDERESHGGQRRINVALLGFLAIAVFFLVSEHRAHVFGFLPLLLLLLCPLLHLFMHGGHGGHGGAGGRDAGSTDPHARHAHDRHPSGEETPR